MTARAPVFDLVAELLQVLGAARGHRIRNSAGSAGASGGRRSLPDIAGRPASAVSSMPTRELRVVGDLRAERAITRTVRQWCRCPGWRRRPGHYWMVLMLTISMPRPKSIPAIQEWLSLRAGLLDFDSQTLAPGTFSPSIEPDWRNIETYRLAGVEHDIGEEALSGAGPGVQISAASGSACSGSSYACRRVRHRHGRMDDFLEAVLGGEAETGGARGVGTGAATPKRS